MSLTTLNLKEEAKSIWSIIEDYVDKPLSISEYRKLLKKLKENGYTVKRRWLGTKYSGGLTINEKAISKGFQEIIYKIIVEKDNTPIYILYVEKITDLDTGKTEYIIPMWFGPTELKEAKVYEKLIILPRFK